MAQGYFICICSFIIITLKYFFKTSDRFQNGGGYMLAAGTSINKNTFKVSYSTLESGNVHISWNKLF